eukprot:CAMPEP_0181064012 /NCGR_PEP_ID=MMETSP1070-20121207/23963_1 /TAXON_ID=265543 /ORGANISM="Minutocellus polymorphus, Strain NH13" /LENGTH=164 /DNA_ID=CAMNT_0023144277 /DNA_START=11 /DNA_END=501 /DNA_ORIENTATION=+
MAPTHLNDTCSESTMVEKGRVECQELCVEYTDCCLEEFCQQNNAEACGTYQPCEILSNEDFYESYGAADGEAEEGDEENIAEQNLPPAPDNLDAICSPIALSIGGLSARADCTSICSEFEECCRLDECLSPNIDACGTYDACEKPEMVLDPSDIPTYCHGSAIL